MISQQTIGSYIFPRRVYEEHKFQPPQTLRWHDWGSWVQFHVATPGAEQTAFGPLGNQHAILPFGSKFELFAWRRTHFTISEDESIRRQAIEDTRVHRNYLGPLEFALPTLPHVSRLSELRSTEGVFGRSVEHGLSRVEIRNWTGFWNFSV